MDVLRTDGKGVRLSHLGIEWLGADELEYAQKVFQALQLRDAFGVCGEYLKNICQFDRLLGRGGMSLIIGVISLKDGVRLALKIPRLEAEGRWKNLFERENGFLRGLSSPSLVKWVGYAETNDGVAGILMEYLSHGTLERTVMGVVHPTSDVYRWFAECLEAVAFLHGRSVAHRDLKPSNFMLTAQGKIKLIDLALATMMGETEVDRPNISGTPVYLPPETRLGLGMDYFRSDLFALTIVFSQMRLGRYLDIPWPAVRPVALLPSDIQRLHAQIAHLPATERTFIEWGTNLDPSRRFFSVRQMSVAFEWATL